MLFNAFNDLQRLPLTNIPNIFDSFVSISLICCFQVNSLSIIKPKDFVLLTCSIICFLIWISMLGKIVLFLALKIIYWVLFTFEESLLASSHLRTLEMTV